MDKDQPILSQREARLAAEMGKPISADIQNKILEQNKMNTRKRIQELQEEEERKKAEKLERERLANMPPMSKRQRQQYEQQDSNSQFPNVPHNSFRPNQPSVEQQVQEEILSNRTYDQQPSLNTGEYQQPYISTPTYDQPSTSIPKIVHEDIENLAKPVSNMVLFKPSEVTNKFKKIKVGDTPSHFLPYPENAEIYITPYSGDEIDELSNSSLTLKYILTKCMEGVYTNFDKNQITFYDALYLSYYRRVLSIDSKDNKIQIISQCPYCNKYSTHIININEQVDFEDVKVPTLPINIDFSFGRLQFTFLTYGDYMKLQSELRSEELAYQCITPCEVDKEAGQTQASELQKLFGSLTGEDQALLSKVKELTYHGIKPITTLCQNKDCGKTYETILDEMSSIILPFRTSNENTRSKVSFG